MGGNVKAADGDTTITKWRDGKAAAVGLAFDDSLWSHVDYVIPMLAKKGLVGSFWVNPATNRYGYGIETWEDRAWDLGMELCSHTMNHTGARSYEEAEYEIGECTKILRALRPAGAGKFMLFLRGGATEWKITDAEMAELMKKYELTRGRGGGKDHGGDEKTPDEVVGYVKEAEADGEFHCIGYHGVGPYAEWLPASAESFTALTDYLVSVRDKVWNGTCGEIHKYRKERESAKAAMVEATGKIIRLDLTCAEDPAFYDAALTLDTVVPRGWKNCLVSQGSVESVFPVRDGVVRYAAVPGHGGIVLAPTDRKPAKPAKRVVNRKARKTAPKGRILTTIDRMPEGATETRDLPAGLTDVSVAFSFLLSKDFAPPEFTKDSRNVTPLVSLADGEGRPLAAVNVYRQGKDLGLFANLQDNGDWHDIPGSPEIPAGHILLEPGREHAVILRTRAGKRDGGAELRLDGRLCCSFLRRDTLGRAAKSVSAGAGPLKGSQGSVRITRVQIKGEYIMANKSIVTVNNGACRGIYGMAVIGAAVYFIKGATTFWGGVWGFVKALFWPAVLMIKLLEYLKL